jgi:hypothetical protein
MTRFDSIYVILMWSNKKLAFYKYLDAKVLEEKKVCNIIDFGATMTAIEITLAVIFSNVKDHDAIAAVI